MDHFSNPPEKSVTNTHTVVTVLHWSAIMFPGHWFSCTSLLCIRNNFYFVKPSLSSLKVWPTHRHTHTEGSVCVRLFSLSHSKCSIFVIITLPRGFNSHSAQRKLYYASFYPLCVVQVQSEGCEKLGSVPEKCSKLWYWILYYAVLLFRDILSDYIFVLQCYNCVWLKGSNISDPNIYDSQNVFYWKQKENAGL